MTVSFQYLWEQMQAHRLEEAAHEDDQAMEAIRSGINIREDFWDDFLLLLNNSEALSELLDIPTVKISGWHSRIHEMLSKTKHADEGPEIKKNRKMIDTGHEDLESASDMDKI